LSSDSPRLASHGKRNIGLLAYDPSGLRTTKTATWQSVDKVLIAKAQPNHLPQPEWLDDIDSIAEERERKGLPDAIGRTQKFSYSANYNQVRW
jgi:hypothetical protein